MAATTCAWVAWPSKAPSPRRSGRDGSRSPRACLAAAERLEGTHDAALDQWRREVERAGYEADKAERRYKTVDPENRLVARGLEAAWEAALQELARAEGELTGREAAQPKVLSEDERAAILALGDDLNGVFDAPTTNEKERKQLLRTLLEEVSVTVERDHTGGQANLVLRWKGGARIEPPAPQDSCSNHDHRRKEQCVDDFKNARMSRSITQSRFQHRCRQAATASSAERPGRYP